MAAVPSRERGVSRGSEGLQPPRRFLPGPVRLGRRSGRARGTAATSTAGFAGVEQAVWGSRECHETEPPRVDLAHSDEVLVHRGEDGPVEHVLRDFDALPHVDIGVVQPLHESRRGAG